MPSQTKNSKTKSLKKVSKQPQTVLISKGSITKQFANTFKLTALEMETTHELPMIEEKFMGLFGQFLNSLDILFQYVFVAYFFISNTLESLF